MARLGDVCSIRSSNHSADKDKNWLLNLDVVEQQTGRVLEYFFVPESGLDGSIISFDTDNVLYSKLRPNLNKVVIPEKNGYATSEMLPLYPDTKQITREYLACYLRSPGFVEWAVSKTAGAKMPRLGTKELLNKEVPLPSIDLQKRITESLFLIDSLISLRKKQLQKLDDLIKSRFIEMFADEKRILPMDDICSIITDGTHQPPKFVHEGIPFIFVSNIIGNVLTYDAEKFIDQKTYDELIKRTPIEIGDILLSTVGSYGHPAVVKSDKKFLFQRHIAYLKPRGEIVDSDYLHGAILSPNVQAQIEKGAKGIAQKTLNLSEIKKIMIPVPEITSQQQFAAFVSQVEKAKTVVQKALNETQLLFDSLMQKYFG